MDRDGKLATLVRIGDGRGIVFDGDVAKLFDPAEPRDHHGRWISGFREITRDALSTPDARRSRAVSSEEFQKIAADGERRMNARRMHRQTVDGLDNNWPMIKADAARKLRQPWGGATYDPATGHPVPDGADLYALTIRTPGKKSVEIDEKASDGEIGKAMDEARSRFADELTVKGAHLGVFHDDDTKSLNIDPVLVVDNMDDVETIGAYTHAVGGAYHFGTGDGYWPPHVENVKAARAGTEHFDGIGQWYSQARKAEGI